MALALGVLASRQPQADPRLKNASRAGERSGWIQVHLEGCPPRSVFSMATCWPPRSWTTSKISPETTHDEKKDWEFFRKRRKRFSGRISRPQYREELTGIADGLKAHGGNLDVWDIVAMNAWMEWPYYDKWDSMEQHFLPSPRGPLQRLRGHRQLHQGWPRGDWA